MTRNSNGTTKASQNGSTETRSISAVGGEHVAQPRPRRRHLAVGRMLRRRPDAQPIFQREDDDRNDLDGGEDALIGGLVARDGFEHHRGHIDEDEQDQQPARDPHGTVAHRTVLEDLIGAVAPPHHGLLHSCELILAPSSRASERGAKKTGARFRPCDRA